MKKFTCLLPILALTILPAPASSAAAAEKPAAPPAIALQWHSTSIKPVEPVSPSALLDSVKLSASRAETVAFTLSAKGEGCFKFRPLMIGDKGKPPQAVANFFEILPFVTKKPSFKGAKVGRHWDPVVPRDRFCVSAGEPKWILVEIRIRSDAKPGDYTAQVVAVSDAAAGTRPQEFPIPLALKVWPMTMPEAPAMPMYAELTTWFLLLGHYGKWHKGEGDLARLYIEAMLDHRIFPLKSWISPLSAEGGSVSLQKVNGQASPDSFLATNVRPVPKSAYISVPLPDEKEGMTGGARYFAELENALTREKLIDRSLLYLWDEPQPEEFKALKTLGAVVRKNAPRLKILVTTTYREEFSSFVDIFVPVMDQYDRPGFPAPSVYRDLQKRGKKVWLYASCMSHGCGNDVDSGSPDWVIDRGGSHIRSLAWLGHKYSLDGLLYYSVNDGYKHFGQGRDPWVDLWDFSGNGDGTLFYPGRPSLNGMKSHAPVTSLRLKLWRQASYDAEYIAWMNGLKSPPAWWPMKRDAVAQSVRTWSKDETRYQSLREDAGDFLKEASE